MTIDTQPINPTEKDNKDNVVEVEEDEDLDDLLDDALDDFSKPNIENQSSSTSNAAPSQEDLDSNALFEEEFARQLSLEMEGMFGKLSEEEDVKSAFAKLMNANPGEGSSQTNLPSSTNPGTSKSASGGVGADFQAAINNSMNKMKTSSDQVEAEAKNDSPEALMEQLMRQMEGFSDTPDFEKAIEGMMGQIMTKDLLYEPMKDLTDKYPEWLETNKSKLSETEFNQYSKQQKIVAEVVESFEKQVTDEKGDVTECEENSALQKRVMVLMQEMQDLGQPPAELLKLISPDLEIGEDGQPKMPKEMEDCCIM